MGKFLEVKNLRSLGRSKRIKRIDPKDIKFLAEQDFRIDCSDEKEADGDWDQNLSLLSEGEIYQALKSVLHEGKAWKDTQYFNDRLSKTHLINACDRNVFRRDRCVYMEYLYRSMKAYGYVQDPISDFVGIAIGRDGEIILNNGRHRVAVAQLLSIPSIPVTIDVRHKEWVMFCSDVHEYALHHRGSVYAPVDHVDLMHLTSRQVDRSDLIVRHMSPMSKTMVDLGAQWGLMTHRLEPYFDKGSCTAVESDATELSFLRKFHKIYDGSYCIADSDAVEFVNLFPKWDCVLMLSILHHIPIDQRDDLFAHLKAKEMFFQLPSKFEMTVDVPKWIDLILLTSCFSKANQISNGDREIFHFTR